MTNSTKEGSETYVIDKSRLSIRLIPPYSDAQIAAARENGLKHGFQIVKPEQKTA
jgi:hypothetical protein